MARPKRKPGRVALSAAPAAGATAYGIENGKVVLAAHRALADGGVELEREAGIMRNLSIITAGDALGHDFGVDQVTLEQVVEGINKHRPNGVRSRLTHPELLHAMGWEIWDDIKDRVGRVMNARLDGDRVRGDVHFKKYARSNPSGDLWEFLFDLAEEDPDSIGLSISSDDCATEEIGPDGKPAAQPMLRVGDIFSVDFVGDPGANPGGLLSSRGGQAAPARSSGGSAMNERLKQYLMSVGLKSGATDAEAIAYWQALRGRRKVKADSLALQEGTENVPAEGVVPPAPTEGEEKDAFVSRCTADPGMTATYADEAERSAACSLIWDEAAIPAPAPAEEPAPEGDSPPAGGEVAQGARGRAPAVQLTAEQRASVLLEDKRRRDGIVALAKKAGLDDGWAQGLCDRGTTIAQATELVALAQTMAPVANVRVGDNRAHLGLAEGIRDAILLRAGKVKVEKPAERSPEFRGFSLLEMGRAFLSAHGVSTTGLTRPQLASLLLNRRRMAQAIGPIMLAQSTSDFDYILQDALGKTLRQAYQYVERTWQRWAVKGTAPDFKDIKRVQLSEAPGLEEVPEGAEYTVGTLSDSRETYVLVTYGKIVVLTRQAIINDDLSAFSRIVPAQGIQCARLEDVTCYAILTTNAALADGYDLFSTDHSNYESSGAAPSVATLGAMRAAMRTQTGPDGETILNIPLVHIIVPAALETTAEQLVSSLVDPTKSNATPNPFANKLQVTCAPQLDATSTTGWYGAGDPSVCDTVEVSFLEGEETPVFEEDEDFGTDGRKWKVRHTCAAKALDHRGLQHNTGTAGSSGSGS